MKLFPPTLEDWQRVREWRLSCPEALRTPYPISPEAQSIHYHEVVAARRTDVRWWMAGNRCAVGLEGISPTNRRAEVSLIVDPNAQGKGIGRDAFLSVLHEAWYTLNLHSVWGECYTCAKSLGFWQKVVPEAGGSGSLIPHTRWWDGRWWNSWLFTIISPIDSKPPARAEGGAYMDPNS